MSREILKIVSGEKAGKAIKQGTLPRSSVPQTVEKPLTGFSDKFLQSAARTPCSPMANNSHSDALRAAYGGCALHSA
ncbi:MAG: hypothetical protein PUH34_07520, partial [Eubacteriales bacterium]|nr:hypothetical protein [Eubacteriales bacterium]